MGEIQPVVGVDVGGLRLGLVAWIMQEICGFVYKWGEMQPGALVISPFPTLMVCRQRRP